MFDGSLLLSEYRCKCGKLLLKGIVFDGNLEIKCKRCGIITKLGSTKMLDDSKHYLLIVNDKGIITAASDYAYHILGYRPNELIGKTLSSINSTFPKEINLKLFGANAIMNEDSYLHLDTIHLARDGKRIPVTVLLKQYSPLSNDKYLLEYVSVKNNINDDEQFKANACDYYFDLDRQGNGEYVSESMEKLFGFAQESVIGKNYFDYLPVAWVIKEKKTFAHFSSLEQSYRAIQEVGLDIKNKPIYSDLYFTTKFNETGKFIGYRVLGWLTKKPNL